MVRRDNWRQRRQEPQTRIDLEYEEWQKVDKEWHTLVTAIVHRGRQALEGIPVRFFVSGVEWEEPENTDGNGRVQTVVRVLPGTRHIAISAQIIGQAAVRIRKVIPLPQPKTRSSEAEELLRKKEQKELELGIAETERKLKETQQKPLQIVKFKLETSGGTNGKHTLIPLLVTEAGPAEKISGYLFDEEGELVGGWPFKEGTFKPNPKIIVPKKFGAIGEYLFVVPVLGIAEELRLSGPPRWRKPPRVPKLEKEYFTKGPLNLFRSVGKRAKKDMEGEE